MGLNSIFKKHVGNALSEVERLDAFVASGKDISLRKFCKWADGERLSMPLFELVLKQSFADERGLFAAWASHARLVLADGAEAHAVELLGAPLAGGSDGLLRAALRGEIKKPGPVAGMSLEEMGKRFEVTHVRWVAADDACPGCRALDGLLFDLGVAEKMIEPRKHEGCRCIWEPVYGFGGGLPMRPRELDMPLMDVFCDAEKLFPGYEEPEPFSPFVPVILSEERFREGEYSDMNSYELFNCVKKTMDEVGGAWLAEVIDVCLSGGLSSYVAARAWKAKGELLQREGDIKGSVNCYEAALSLDEKIGVKRLLTKLKK